MDNELEFVQLTDQRSGGCEQIMKEPLRVLIIEDSEADTHFVLRELKRGGFDPIFERVDSAAGLSTALGTSEWDVIVSDHSMPGFGSLEALRLLKQKGM